MYQVSDRSYRIHKLRVTAVCCGLLFIWWLLLQLKHDLGIYLFSLVQIAEVKYYKSAKANIQASTEAKARISKVEQKPRSGSLEKALPKYGENYYHLDL